MPPRERAREAVAKAAQRTNGGNAVAVRRTQLDGIIARNQEQFTAAMPKGREATQLIRDAMNCLRTIPKLDECDDMSLIGSLMTAAQLGLRPGVLGQCWPLPFWDSKAKHRRAQLVIGYKGYVQLAHQSGMVADVIARPVYSADTFDVEYGLNERLVHKPFMDGERGESIAYYCVIRYRSGGYAFLVMSQSEVDHHRDRYATSRNADGELFGPWTDPDDSVDMALKTVFLQLAKWAPKSPEVVLAMQWDSRVRTDTSPDASPDVPAATLSPPSYDVEGEMTVPDAGPPETAEPATEPDPGLSPPDERQMKRLHAVLGGLGLGGDAKRDERNAVLSDLAGRPIHSSGELTGAEAEQQSRFLADIGKRPEPDRPLVIAEMVERGRAVHRGQATAGEDS